MVSLLMSGIDAGLQPAGGYGQILCRMVLCPCMVNVCSIMEIVWMTLFSLFCRVRVWVSSFCALIHCDSRFCSPIIKQFELTDNISPSIDNHMIITLIFTNWLYV